MLDILRSRNILLILSGRFISTTGDWLYAVALSVAIYAYSGKSTTAVGFLWLARFAPFLVLGPFSGAAADLLGYRRTMIASDIVRMLLIAGLALVLSASNWGLIFPVVTIGSVVNTLFRPASVAIIPALADREEQMFQINGALWQVESVASVVGSMAGGIFSGTGAVRPLLLLQALSFGLSALSLLFLHVKQTQEASLDQEPVRVLAGLTTGLRLVLSKRSLVFAALVMALPELAAGSYFVWVVPYSHTVIHLGDAGVGYLYAALGVGSILGGLVSSAAGTRVSLKALLALSTAVSGVAIILFGLWPLAAAALAATLVLGGAQVVEYVAEETTIQQSVPTGAIGRATGTIDGFLFVMILIGTVLSGPLAGAIGLQTLIAAVGVLCLIFTVVLWLLFSGQEDVLTSSPGPESIPALTDAP